MANDKDRTTTSFLRFPCDLEKALISFRQPSICKVMRAYGFLSNVVNIFRDLYATNPCYLTLDGQQSDWFHVKADVRQSSVISPILFLLDADWEMRKITEGQQRGLAWDLTDRFEDNDFASDIALFLHAE